MDTWRVRALALAATAAVALSAGAASAAQAAKYRSEIATTTFLAGTQQTQNVLTTKVGTVKCEVAAFAATQSGSEAGTVILMPQFEKCKAFGQLEKWEFNGCTFKLLEPIGLGPFQASVEIACPAEQRIEILVPTANCRITVLSTGVVGGSVQLTNQGSERTRSTLITWQLTGLRTLNNGPGTFCGAIGVEDTTGMYNGTTVLKGYSDAAHTAQVGVFVG